MALLDDADDQLLEIELYDLLIACADFLRRDVSARASEANLGGPDFLALREMALARAPMAPSDLALLLRCSRAKVTKISDRLLSAGYINKERVPLRAHAKTLSLTSAGLEALSRAIICMEPANPFARLTPRQQKQLHQLLGRLAQSLEAGPLFKQGSSAEVVHAETPSAAEVVHAETPSAAEVVHAETPSAAEVVHG